MVFSLKNSMCWSTKILLENISMEELLRGIENQKNLCKSKTPVSQQEVPNELRPHEWGNIVWSYDKTNKP